MRFFISENFYWKLWKLNHSNSPLCIWAAARLTVNSWLLRQHQDSACMGSDLGARPYILGGYCTSATHKLYGTVVAKCSTWYTTSKSCMHIIIGCMVPGALQCVALSLRAVLLTAEHCRQWTDTAAYLSLSGLNLDRCLPVRFLWEVYRRLLAGAGAGTPRGGPPLSAWLTRYLAPLLRHSSPSAACSVSRAGRQPVGHQQPLGGLADRRQRDTRWGNTPLTYCIFVWDTSQVLASLIPI